MIKKLLLTVFLFATIISANDKLKWYGFDEGLAKAKKENKFLLVDFYTDWCGWCKKMDSETYANNNIIKLLNKDFVLVKLNPEKPGTVNFDSNTYTNGQFAGAAGVNGYPATGFFEPSGQFIGIVPGYLDPTNFSDLLSKIVAKDYLNQQ